MTSTISFSIWITDNDTNPVDRVILNALRETNRTVKKRWGRVVRLTRKHDIGMSKCHCSRKEKSKYAFASPHRLVKAFLFSKMDQLTC